jgi:two-component system nitrogen regulation response regulator GlnG
MPFDLKELTAIVQRALAAPGRKRATAETEPSDERLPLIGRSPAMQEIYRIIARLTQADLTVMISGESGTGKELVARALHDYGKRRNGPFVAINMAAIPRDLIESELFGHEKGAFTGAIARRIGKFEEADGGTLLLDEISEMDIRLQAKLLRAIQEREIERVGAETPVGVDVRLLAATRHDLAALVKAGTFREDLYYRLHVVSLRLPPLRERRQDVPALVDHFLRTLPAKHGRGPVGIDASAQAALLAYDWPGNIRELENVLERALVLAAHDVLTKDDLPLEIAAALESGVATGLAPGVAPGAGPGAPPSPEARATLLPLEEVERLHVLRVLDAVDGNREEAARVLGISRRTLSRMARRWTLPGPRPR